MKQGKPLITFVILLFAAALACYFAYYVWGTFQDPITTAYVYEYELNDSLEAEGLLVRSEQVLPGGQGILDVTRARENRWVWARRWPWCTGDDQAQQNQAQQEALRLEITQLRYAIGQSGDINSVARVNEEILQGLVALRASSALDDYSALEDQVLEIKGNVLRREYTYGADLTEEDLSARLSDLTAQYQALQSQNSSAVTQIIAPQAGTFSTLVDGYETLVNLETVLQLTPAGLQGLLEQLPRRGQHCGGQADPVQAVVLCRPCVRGGGGERLREQTDVTMRFVGEFSKEIPMQVEQVGPEENGQAVVGAVHGPVSGAHHPSAPADGGADL